MKFNQSLTKWLILAAWLSYLATGVFIGSDPGFVGAVLCMLFIPVYLVTGTVAIKASQEVSRRVGLGCAVLIVMLIPALLFGSVYGFFATVFSVVVALVFGSKRW